MKSFFLILIASVASAKPNGKIVGGEEAPKHAFPWQISLRSLGMHHCGGSIINENQVMTAAHCVEGAAGVPAFDSVIAGAHDRFLEAGHQKRNIKNIASHDDHNKPGRFNNDIAIITVTEPFDFSDPNVQPIEFFTLDDAEIPTETVCNVTGWGQTSGAFPFLPNALQWTQVPVRASEDCSAFFEQYLTDGMICAGNRETTVCNGDSGGPLVCPDATGKGKLAGLVSFGRTSCDVMGVFAKVSYYEEWIQERLEP